MFCRKCGQPLQEDDKFCPICGTQTVKIQHPGNIPPDTHRRPAPIGNQPRKNSGPKKKPPYLAIGAIAAVAVIAIAVGILFFTRGGDTDGNAKADGSDNAKSSKVSWTWGAANGMSGNAEYTFDDEGFVTDVKLYNGANDALYRELVYSYDSGLSALDSNGYPSCLTTLDGGGNKLYDYYYTWSACEREEDSWYNSYSYGYDYILEETCTTISYQELSHTVLSSTMNNTMGKSAYYWITEWKGDERSVTHVYAKDGREEEDLLINWDYDNGDLEGIRLGRYEKVYEAETDKDGTITLTLDESHKGEEKELTQIYTYTLEYTEDGKPARYSYHFYKEYDNTDEPADDTDSITFTYEGDALSKVVCSQETTKYDDRTFLYDENGNLISEDHMQSSIGRGDIGARSYEYYDNNVLKAIHFYHDFTTEDSSTIQETWYYDENGLLESQD